jgi:hypothetical protein
MHSSLTLAFHMLETMTQDLTLCTHFSVKKSFFFGSIAATESTPTRRVQSQMWRACRCTINSTKQNKQKTKHESHRLVHTTAQQLTCWCQKVLPAASIIAAPKTQDRTKDCCTMYPRRAFCYTITARAQILLILVNCGEVKTAIERRCPRDSLWKKCTSKTVSKRIRWQKRSLMTLAI